MDPGPDEARRGADGLRWYTGVDALWLVRDYPGSFLLARTVDRTATTIPGGTIALNDVRDSAARPGLRAWAGFGVRDHTDVELSYFGLQNWGRTAAIRVQDPPFANSAFLGTSVPFANKSFDTTLAVRLDSEIHSAELNLRRGFALSGWNATALVGVRYFRLSESIALTGVETFTATTERTRTAAANNLFGAQIGTELARYWLDDRIGLSVSGKVGIFSNNASQFTTNSTRPFGGGPGTSVLQAGRGDTDVAGLYETGITATVRLTSRVTVRGGYQLLYVQGLALAPDQLALTGGAIRSFPQTPFPPGTGARLRTDGDLLLHGPRVGLAVSY